MKIKYVLLLLTILLMSCNVVTEETVKTDVVNVLILGNSITQHDPSSVIGWHGDWGMAASSKDKDYVHVLKSMLENKYNNTVFNVTCKNIAQWERNFDFNLSGYSDIENCNADILIVRLGENVASMNDFGLVLKNLVNDYSNMSTDVFITGNFWANQYMDSVKRTVATENSWNYVSLSHVSSDLKSYAYGEYDNAGVASHPNDRGMKKIAEALFDEIIKDNSSISVNYTSGGNVYTDEGVLVESGSSIPFDDDGSVTLIINPSEGKSIYRSKLSSGLLESTDEVLIIYSNGDNEVLNIEFK